MKTPLVSVIIPVHRTKLTYVKQCIDSVLSQTYPKDRVEIVMCEDGSGNKYRVELIKLLKRRVQGNIKLLLNRSQKGLSYSRNRAVAHSEGEWVLILDSDDVVARTAIADMVKAAAPDTVMVYSDHARVSCDLRTTRYVRNKSLYHKLLKKYEKVPLYNPVFSSVFLSHGELLKKKVLEDVGGYKGRIGEKPQVWISIFEAFGAAGLEHVPKVLYYYRENQNGIVSRGEPKLIKTHEKTFLNAIRRHDKRIIRAKYLGRIGAFKVKHFAFYDKNMDMIKMPYIDYDRRAIRALYL